MTVASAPCGWREVLGAIGRAFITAGVLILLFVAYQLWGTGIREAQAQNRLEDDFAEALDEADHADHRPRPPTTQPATTPTTVPTTRSAPDEPVRRRASRRPASRSRRSASTRSSSRASSLDDLKKGPATTPRPRCPGRRATPPSPGTAPPTAPRSTGSTSSQPGDEIIVDTVQGEFTYEVPRPSSSRPDPGRGARGQGRQPAHAHGLPPEVQRPAAHRRRVRCWRPTRRRSPPPDRAEDARHARRRSTTSTARGAGLAGDPLGLLCAAIWLLAWLVGRRWRKWPAYAHRLPVLHGGAVLLLRGVQPPAPSNF